MFEVRVGTELELGAGQLVLAHGAEAVGKLFAVAGEALSDGEWCRVDQAQEEATRGPCCLCSTYTQRAV